MKNIKQKIALISIIAFMLILNAYPQGINKIITKQLDSVVGFYYRTDRIYDIDSKKIYYYDNSGNETGNITYRVDLTQHDPLWMPYRQENHSYNSREGYMESTSSKWNRFTRDWEPESKNAFLNDDNGNRILNVDFVWNELVNKWFESTKSESEYDSEGRLISLTQYYWYYLVTPWEPDTHEEWEYDSNGDLVKYESFSWNPANRIWMNDAWEEYFYDLNGKLRLKNRFKWNYLTQDWDLTNKQEWRADSTGLEITSTCFCWNSDLRIWDEEKQSLCCYDSSGNELSEVNLIWDSNKGWMKSDKTECCYNSSGEKTGEAKYHWSEDLSTWIGDEMGNHSLELDYFGDPVSQEIFDWDNDTRDWKIKEKYLYHYHAASSNIQKDFENDIKIFPNPSSGIVNISNMPDNNSVEVYNIHGQVVKSLSQVEHNINLSDLISGIYFLNIRANNTIAVKRLVLQK